MKSSFAMRSAGLTLLGSALVFLPAVGAWARTTSAPAANEPVVFTHREPPTITPQEAKQAVQAARSLSTAFRVVSEHALPAVVAIENRPAPLASSTERGTPDQANPFEGTPFAPFFQSPQGRPRLPERQHGGLGSGVIYDASGLILTNNHVVAGGGQVSVRLQDGREFPAKEVWTDPKTDVAVVRIDARDLSAMEMGDSDTVSVGDWVLALGQPFGLESTVTAGIISAKNRGVGIAPRESFLQTDAAINPGNSGGPLVDLDGHLIGINTAISSRGGGNDGVGFAIPINLARWVAEQLVKGGTVHRAFLGVGIQALEAKIAAPLGVKPREGVVVTEVVPNAPAAKAGVRAGDVIQEFAGQKVSSPQELQIVVERAEIGRVHELKILRDGKSLVLSLRPEEQAGGQGTRSSGLQENESSPTPTRLEKLGLELQSLTPDMATRLGYEGVEGVLIRSVSATGPAHEQGLEAGMIILQVDGHAVTSLEDVHRAIENSKAHDVLLLVKSQNGSRFVVLED